MVDGQNPAKLYRNVIFIDLIGNLVYLKSSLTRSLFHLPFNIMHSSRLACEVRATTETVSDTNKLK